MNHKPGKAVHEPDAPVHTGPASQKLTEIAGSGTTDKYLNLLNSMQQAFCILEMIPGNKGEAADYIYLETNKAFDEQSKLHHAAGKSLRQLQPAQAKNWSAIFNDVLRTGKAIQFIQEAKHPGDYAYELNAMPIGPESSRQVAVLFNDITERRRREMNAAFLAEIKDDLSRLTSPEEIMQSIGAKIGAYMQVASCNFLDIDDEEGRMNVSYSWIKSGLPVLAGVNIRIKDYMNIELEKASRAGKTTVVNNTYADSRTDAEAYAKYEIGAFVIVPFYYNTKWRYLLSVIDSRPRNWREDEIALFHELAGNIFPWLERARTVEALCKSEALLQKAFSTEAVGVLFFNLDGKITGANDTFARMSGYSKHELLENVQWKSFSDVQGISLTPPEFMEITLLAAADLANKGETAPFEKQLIRKDGSRWWGLFAPTRISGEGKDAQCVEFIIDISTRKTAEEALAAHNYLLEKEVAERTQALRKSKDHLQAAMDVSPLTLCVLKSIRDNDNKIVDFCFEWVSKSGEKLIGIDVTGKNMLEQFPYSYEIGLFNMFVNSVETGAPTDIESLYDAEGYNLWLRWKGVKLNDGMFVSVEDISERKQAEVALRESKLFTEQLIEASPNFIMLFNLNTNKFEYINRNNYKNTEGRVIDTMIVDFDKLLDRVHQDDRMPLYHFIEKFRTAADNEIHKIEYRVLGNEGMIWYRSTGKVFKRDENNYPTHYMSVVQDITAYKLAEDALKEQSHFIKQVADTTPDILNVLDVVNNQVIYTNREVYEILGYSPEYMSNMRPDNILQVIHPDDKNKVMDFLKQILHAEDNELVEVEFRIYSIEQELFWLHTRGKVFKRDEYGNVTQIIAASQDITEKKMALGALINAEKLEIANSFARTIAHEVRNPLTTVNLSLKMLKYEARKLQNEKINNYVNTIERNSKRVDHLITQLLYSARRNESNLSKVYICDILDEALAEARDRIEISGTQVEKLYLADTELYIDAESVKIAILSLIINAIEAMKAQTGILKITTQNIDSECVIAISDNGRGIEEEAISRIFEPFYTTKIEGMGLGLTNTKNIIESSKGRISVESKPGIGTTFYISFPM